MNQEKVFSLLFAYFFFSTFKNYVKNIQVSLLF